MDKVKIKKRLESRFRSKIKGQVKINYKTGSTLIIEYMYGNRYCVKRRENNKENVIELVTTMDRVVDLIAKEKFRKFK